MNTTKTRRLSLLVVLLLTVVVAYVAIPVRLGVVWGNSMSPSMQHGSLYFFERPRDHREIRKGDVVVFKHNGATYLKRVLASPGDTIYVLTIPGTGQDDFVMDWELDQVRRLTHKSRAWYAGKVVARRVPRGFFYAVGDHMDASVDSRDFGPVPVQNIMGKLVHPPAPLAVLSHVAGTFVPGTNLDRS